MPRHANPDLLAATDAAVEGAASVGAGRGVSNLLMLVGLLGTIFGLSGVVSSLRPQFDAAKMTGDTQTIVSNLQGTLTTMGTAFSATAYGILFAAITGYVTTLVTERRAAACRRYSNASRSREVAPGLLPSGAGIENKLESVQHELAISLAPLTEQRETLAELRNLILQGQDQLRHSVEQATALLERNEKFVGESGRFVEQTERAIAKATEDLHAALRDVAKITWSKPRKK